MHQTTIPVARVRLVDGGFERVRDDGTDMQQDAIVEYARLMSGVLADAVGRLTIGRTDGRHFGASGRCVLSHRRAPDQVTRIDGSGSHGAIVFDDTFAELRAGRAGRDPVIAVANDLGRIVADYVALEGKGPVRNLLPWLAGIAATVVVYGDGDDEDFTSHTVTRYVEAIANAEFGDVNAMGKLVTAHPDLEEVCLAVAEEATRRRRRRGGRLTFDRICDATSNSIVAALTSLGVQLDAGRSAGFEAATA